MFLNEKFIILDICIIKNIIIQISCIKIKKDINKLYIIESKNFFIKNEYNHDIYKNTKITKDLLDFIGLSIDICIDNIYKFCDNLDVYVYGNFFEFSKYLKKQKYIDWYKNFKDLRFLYNLLNINTNLYTSSNIYRAFNLEIYEIKYNSLWSVYSIFKSLNYIKKRLDNII